MYVGVDKDVGISGWLSGLEVLLLFCFLGLRFSGLESWVF